MSKIDTFRRLHESGCFVIPNPWDRGSAIYLQSLGFSALASTSAGLAWSLGKPDNKITLEDVLVHLSAIASAVEIPVNADFEDGFVREPEGVAANVARAVQTGISGLSIEDSTRDGGEPLYAFDLALERVKAARAAIDRSKTGVLLTARTEGFLVGRADIKETVRRLEAFAAAGADCLYAPGIRTKEDITAVVKAVAPKPVNLLVAAPFITVAEARDLGVRRVSVGGGLARAAWGGLAKAASELAERGTFDGMTPVGPPVALNKLFG